MRNSKNIIIGLITIIIIIGFVLTLQIIEAEKYIKENEILIKENEILKEEQYTERVDFLVEIYDAYAKIGELKERIKWLEKQPYNIDNIVSDLDDIMEWTIRYYEVEPQTIRDAMVLTEYILWKDSKLYERILNEWQ